MGILSSIRLDVEDLVKEGYPDDYIAKSVGIDKTILQHIIDYVRQNLEVECPFNNKINNRGKTT